MRIVRIKEMRRTHESDCKSWIATLVSGEKVFIQNLGGMDNPVPEVGWNLEGYTPMREED